MLYPATLHGLRSRHGGQLSKTIYADTCWRCGLRKWGERRSDDDDDERSSSGHLVEDHCNFKEFLLPFTKPWQLNLGRASNQAELRSLWTKALAAGSDFKTPIQHGKWPSLGTTYIMMGSHPHR